MSDEYETINYRNHEIVVLIDLDPANPRTDWDNLGTMICFHSEYTLGDRHEFNIENYACRKELERAIIKAYDPVIMLPLFLYDHSGLSMKIGSFQGYLPQGHAEWDTSPVGWILVEKERVLSEYGKKRITKKLIEKVQGILESEVETYNEYLMGSVYGYMIRNQDGDLDGGCWGFYGTDWENNGLMEHARPEVDYAVNEAIKEGVQACIDNRELAFQQYIEAIETTWDVQL